MDLMLIPSLIGAIVLTSPCVRTATQWLGSEALVVSSAFIRIEQPLVCDCSINRFVFELPPSADEREWLAARYGDSPSGPGGVGVEFSLDVARQPLGETTSPFEVERVPTRPLVTASLPGVADPFVGPGSLRLVLRNLFAGLTSITLADLAPGAPQATLEALGDPGPTTLEHAIRLTECQPDEPYGPLVALQQIVHGLIPASYPSAREIAQRFIVPERCSALWLELPVVTPAAAGTPLGVTVEVHAIGDGPMPIGPLPVAATTASLVDTGLVTSVPTWLAAPLAIPLVLEPGTVYTLVARFAPGALVTATDLSGRDLLPGSIWVRDDTSSAWVEVAGAELGLRVMGLAGTPYVDASMGSPVRTTAARVSVAPNPSGAACTVRWEGATGAVRLEIVDVRGRRVRVLDGGHAGFGQCQWDGRDSHGRSSPPGVYFVTLHDARGAGRAQRVLRSR